MEKTPCNLVDCLLSLKNLSLSEGHFDLPTKMTTYSTNTWQKFISIDIDRIDLPKYLLLLSKTELCFFKYLYLIGQQELTLLTKCIGVTCVTPAGRILEPVIY